MPRTRCLCSACVVNLDGRASAIGRNAVAQGACVPLLRLRAVISRAPGAAFLVIHSPTAFFVLALSVRSLRIIHQSGALSVALQGASLRIRETTRFDLAPRKRRYCCERRRPDSHLFRRTFNCTSRTVGVFECGQTARKESPIIRE